MRPRLTSTKGKERPKCGERRELAHDPKHTSSSVKHGEGSVMAWACMAASVVGSLIFIDAVIHDHSSRMNSGYKNILSANLWRNASKQIGRDFIMQQDNDPKRNANITKDFIRWKKWKVLLLSQVDWAAVSSSI